LDGFCDGKFPDDPIDYPDNPVIRHRPAAVAMMDLVDQFPGINFNETSFWPKYFRTKYKGSKNHR
jgi:hypothetical protein